MLTIFGTLFGTTAAASAKLFSSIVAADFLTGLLHWSEDTWTVPGRSKLLDRFIVLDNIDHHRRPGLIRAGDYWGTNRVCIALAAFGACVALFAHVHAWPVYLVLALVSQSNQIHMWAHCSNPPRLVARLQRLGILQSTSHHAVHHKRPYAVRFCALTNFLNPVLDALGFWRSLEWVIVSCGGTVVRACAARGGY
ncbi:MAG TPA: fatty acid desaturase CarF family protein [Candidatus Baltobacteraceae bacterium]